MPFLKPTFLIYLLLGPETVTADDANEAKHQLVSFVAMETLQTLLISAMNSIPQP